MYFHSRAQAGQKLASSLLEYQHQPCVVIALNKGGVPVGEVIAQKLDCPLTILLSEDITLPGEHMALGTVNQDGGFVYNNDFTHGQSDEYYSEFHNYIDDQKRERFAKMNRLLGADGLLRPENLRDHVAILIADGLGSGTPLESAMLFLKPIKLRKLIIAVPIASVGAVDRMHILADDIRCLSVTDNFISTSHYYDTNDSDDPDFGEVLAKLKQASRDGGAASKPRGTVGAITDPQAQANTPTAIGSKQITIV